MAASGQITIAIAGTALRGTSVVGREFLFAPHPDNTDAVWVGNVSDDVSNSNGFPLEPGGSPIYIESINLNQLWFDVNVGGEKICWIRVRI